MVCFRTKNPNLGKCWKVLQWKMLVYFMDTWSILRSFVIFYGFGIGSLWKFGNFSRFGILYEEKSGNPGCHTYPVKNKLPSFVTSLHVCTSQFGGSNTTARRKYVGEKIHGNCYWDVVPINDLYWQHVLSIATCTSTDLTVRQNCRIVQFHFRQTNVLHGAT
jgi:hypothetical protein